MKQSTGKLAYDLESSLGYLKRSSCIIKDDASLKRSERMTLILISKLSVDQPVTTSLVADRLGVTLAAVTHHINSLGEDGLVERSLSTDDRRVTFITLTQKGKQKIAELKKIHQKTICDLVEYLGAEDTKQLISLIAKISDFIKTKRKEEQC